MAKVSLRNYNREIEAMIDRGQLDEAIANCLHILKTFPKHLETYRLLGKAYLEYKRYPEAVDIFSRVLVASPSDFVAHVGMSIIRDEENKLDDAIWHMERAFETQPSNAAIQGELQRLYGRRDGVQPPRIRMTRGALAQMYVQGELYPQAISEIKSVLKEDAGRSDMQALLARAYYRSGHKNDAADVASALLRRYPYSIDANRVLVEILGSDKPENAQVYRQRVVELDPYAAQVTGTVFQSNEVPDAAVSLEHLDWNGQPTGMKPDWASTQAISLDSGRSREEQPDWLKGSFAEPAPQAPASNQPPVVPALDLSKAPTQPPVAEENIPDFLRAAGWSKSTGAFDESKPVFTNQEPSTPAQPIEQGELPDWVKAMAPPEVTQPAQEEEMPDWINKIGTGVLGSVSSTSNNEEPDWMSQLSQPEQPAPSEPAVTAQPDWTSQLNQPEQPAPSGQASSDQPDWMSQLSEPEQSASSEQASTDQPDWLKQFSEPVSATPTQREDQPDWLKEFGSDTTSTPSAPSAEQPDWFKQMEGQPESTPSLQPPSDFDFLDELTKEPEQPIPVGPVSSAKDASGLGTSGQERDDSFAWLENLAAKQGASEDLPTQSEEHMEKEQVGEPAEMQPPLPPPVSQAPAKIEELGKSEQERDDSFAWLESLAAKQGASEGLLTKPEDRMEEEPDWVKQAKGMGVTQPLAETPVSQPSANLEELGKSEQERDDSFAWLESLAAKQGASEGLLTKPEERPEQEPEWVQQAKELGEVQPPSQPVEEPSSVSDTAAWLRSLDEEKLTPMFPSEKDETAMWLKSLDEAEAATTQPPTESELPEWMQILEEGKPQEVEPALPAKEAEDIDWLKSVEKPVAESPVAPQQQIPESETENLPGWLSGLDKEEAPEPVVSAPADELPAWLRDETGETVAEPPKIEPTQSTDWHPVESKQVEEPVPAMPEIVPPPPQEEPKPVVPPKGKKAAVRSELKPAPVPEPYKEPVTRKGTGMLTMTVDMVLGQARNELSRSNIPGALETYAKLIKKGRFLDEVIHDLRDALYRYPVEVSIWQSLGDAYMRANRLQDALDAYTKAEELLR